MATTPQSFNSNLALRVLHPAGPPDRFSRGMAGALVLHIAIGAAIAGWTWYKNRGQNWGDIAAANSAIQATMVNALPLPPRQPTNEQNVLATESPSPAPITAPRTIEAPRPDDLEIQAKQLKKPPPVAEKNTPPPPLHPQPTQANPTQVQTGEASGVRIAMSSDQTRVGTFTVGVTDANFGVRFAYYNQQIKRKLESEWQVNMLDPAAQGHRVYITFQIARDGSPSQVRVQNGSGDPTLDQTAIRAVQVVDTFGPLPDAYQGSYVNVQYYFEAPPHQ